MPPMIELQEAVFGIEDQAITGPVNLMVEPGEKVLLDGPSGSGKTSLFRGLLGFLTLVEGTYLYEGEEVNRQAIWTLRQHASYISQELTMGHGQTHTWLRDCLPENTPVHEADLAEFHLTPSILEKSMGDLSRGERQRLAMVVSVLRKPKLFLLDEITSALNADLRQEVIRYFSRAEATVIAIAHDEEWHRGRAFRQQKIQAS